MRLIRLLVLCLTILVLAACNLSSEPDRVQPLVTATGITGGKPVVTITSPANGAEVVINDKALISATATDTVGVQRVQLLANGQIVKTVSSEAPSGDTSLSVVLDYTPRQLGEVNLAVIAYRGAVASDPAPLRLVVRERQQQVTATSAPVSNVPQIDPNDPTCRILTNVGLNLRTGPGTNYNVITVLRAGALAPMVGRLGTNEWWQVRVNTTIGWVSAAYTTVYGNCGGIPIVVPPPTPTSQVTSTPPPTFTPPPSATPPAPTVTPGLPDLVISAISGPQELTLAGGAGEVVGTYAVTLTNTGDAITSQFSNVVIKTPGNVEIPLGVVGSLGRNQSILLTVEVTFDQPGSYLLQIRADSGSNITELSEVNNTAVYSVNVTAGA